MKLIKGFFKWLLIILIIVNVLILVTGNTHIYKGLQHTYLKGRSGPSPTEYTIFANNEIKANKELPWAVSKNYNKLELSAVARKELEDFKSLAFLVIKNDSILYEEYWDEGAKGSITNSFSMAKTFVSVLVGIAIGEGKIKNEDQAVGDFIPEYKVGENAKLLLSICLQ
jgi:CubicO group peptidase (beta-lactamase class C family)